jgi:signal transduction histidine kinase
MISRSASLTGRTLLQVAIGVTCIVAIASATSYYLLFAEMQRRALNELSRTVSARGRAEGEVFLLARDLQQVIRSTIVEKYPNYLDAHTLARFDELFVRHGDGAIRSRPELLHGPNSVSGWINRNTPLTAELRQRMVLLHDICEQYKSAALLRFVDIFITAPEQLNVGTDPPGLPLWGLTVPADFDQNAEDWGSLGDAAHDPTREVVWLPPSFDSVWQKPLSAVATPIYIDGRHIATLYDDLLLDQMVAKLVLADVPGVKHAIFDRDGTLIAHTDKMGAIATSKGHYRIDARRDPMLAAMLESALRNPGRSVSGYHAATDQYFALGQIAGPGWSFASMQSGTKVRAEAFRSAQWVLWSGLGSLALLLAVLAGILRRQIARPLRQLTEAAEFIARGEVQPLKVRTRPDELGRLAAAFDDMSLRVAERDAALRKETRDLQHALATLRDSEERSRAMSDALHQSEKLASMGSLLAGVAHELNNPLSVVIGRATMLEAAAKDTATISGIRKLRTAAERCERIVKTFLAMARRRQPQRLMVGIHEIIETALDVLVYTLQKSGIDVQYERTSDIPDVCVDPDQLHQVFINLFVNAEQAMCQRDGERVLRLAVRHLVAEEQLQIVVSDTGPGIAAEIRGRIFDPYFTTKSIGEGTGVGLSVSMGIVQAHGGTLCVECPPEGGATFVVSLPLAKAFEN